MSGSRDSILTSALLLAAVIPAATPAATLAAWVDGTAEAYRRHALRASRDPGPGGESPVAIRCSSAEHDDVCTAAAHALARALEDADHRVLAPRRDFSAVRSWDDVGCDDQAPDRLGWEVIELRVRGERHLRLEARVRQGPPLFAGPVRVDPREQRAAQAWQPPFRVVDADVEGSAARVASYLAHALACDLKARPQKRLLELEVAQRALGGGERGWLGRVGRLLEAHLQRVISSSYHDGEPWKLELRLERDATGARTVLATLGADGAGPLERCAVDLAGLSAPPVRESLRTRLVRIANHLDVPAPVWSECLDIFGRPADERGAFVELLEHYDPRTSLHSPWELYRAWNAFDFPGSPAAGFAREVAERLRQRLM